ncbi:MAG: Hpt domain-containing protein [Deltaproteobacteria bacterium]|nr:Hpt domain-containing protein [Deltaproteobacteria bacterium]
MPADNKSGPQATRAYHLFLQELSGHLAFARELVSTPREQQDDWDELARAVHMVKGGAGFFGLSEVAGIAAQLEARLRQPLNAVLKQCDELTKLVAELEKIEKTLPGKD